MITSKDNELIKSLSKLLTSPKYRREHSEFAAEGVRLCADGAQSGAEISWFIYTARAAEKYAAEFALLHSCCQKSCEISESLLKKIADTKSPQGFICVFKMNSSCFQVKKTGKIPCPRKYSGSVQYGNNIAKCGSIRHKRSDRIRRLLRYLFA